MPVIFERALRETVTQGRFEIWRGKTDGGGPIPMKMLGRV